MTISISKRLTRALDRPEIPAHVQREVHNAVCGPDAKDPPEMAYAVIRAALQGHLKVLRSNKATVRSDLRAVWQEYYDCISGIPAQIKAADRTSPLPRELSQWQGWVPKEERQKHYDAFDRVYDARPAQGSKIVPFAPLAYRQENLERLRRCAAALVSSVQAWNTAGTPDHPRSHLRLGAVVLAAARQAEMAMAKYRKALTWGTVHPYETPAKSQWQHYCDQETRERVRRLTANPGDLYFDFAPYEAFFQE